MLSDTHVCRRSHSHLFLPECAPKAGRELGVRLVVLADTEKRSYATFLWGHYLQGTLEVM